MREEKMQEKIEETMMGSVWAETGIGHLRRGEREREKRKGAEMRKGGGEKEREKIN